MLLKNLISIDVCRHLKTVYVSGEYIFPLNTCCKAGVQQMCIMFVNIRCVKYTLHSL